MSFWQYVVIIFSDKKKENTKVFSTNPKRDIRFDVKITTFVIYRMWVILELQTIQGGDAKCQLIDSLKK